MGDVGVPLRSSRSHSVVLRQRAAKVAFSCKTTKACTLRASLWYVINSIRLDVCCYETAATLAMVEHSHSGTHMWWNAAVPKYVASHMCAVNDNVISRDTLASATH